MEETHGIDMNFQYQATMMPTSEANIEYFSADMNSTDQVTGSFEEGAEFSLFEDANWSYDLFGDTVWPDDHPWVIPSARMESTFDDLTAENHDFVQQSELPLHQVEQSFLNAEENVPQIEASHQIEEAPQTQHLPIEEQVAHPVNAACQVKDKAILLEHNDAHMHSAHLVNVGVSATTPSSAFKAITSSATTNIFDNASNIDSGFEGLGEPVVMDSLIIGSASENSYVVPEEQSEDGLAGLFGLTLDQVKSGMRNKKADLRNKMIEKSKLATDHPALQFAEAKNSKSPTVEVTTSSTNVQEEEMKSHAESIASPIEQQPTAGSDVTNPVKPNLPEWISQAHFDEINKVARDAAFLVYGNLLKKALDKVRIEFKQKAENTPVQISEFDQCGLQASVDHSVQLNPFQPQQQASEIVQGMHNGNNYVSHSQPNSAEQALDHVSSISGHHAVSSNSQQQLAYLTPGRSPMQVGQVAVYNTPQNPYTNPYYPAVQGNQGGFFPSPLITTPPMQQESSYGASMGAGQYVGHQSPNTTQGAFNFAQQIPQQVPQMGAYSGVPQPWQLAQQGSHIQQPLYGAPFQYAQQPNMYYNPNHAPQLNGFIPQYDHQKQAQVIAQQNRIRQAQAQQPGMQYQATGLTQSSKVGAAKANSAASKRKLTLGDFPKNKRRG